MDLNNRTQFGVVTALIGATVALAAMHLKMKLTKKEEPAAAQQQVAQPETQKQGPEEIVAVIGDVGGTNVRLTLRRLNLRTRTSTEIKPLTKIPSQETESFSAALGQFLAEYERGSENWPKIGVIGIAGEVKNNIVCTTNIPRWGPTDGKHVSQEFDMEQIELVNDFVAAGQ